MSGNVGDDPQVEMAPVDDEVVADVLEEVERALSQPPPPVEDHLGALAAQLDEERVEHGRLSAPLLTAHVDLDDAWASEDEAPTTEWRRPTSAAPSPEMQAVLQYIRDHRARQAHTTMPSIDMTPLPATVSVEASEPPPRRRFPMLLAAVAVVSVGAAVASYQLGPHAYVNGAAAMAPGASQMSPAPQEQPITFAAPVQTERLMVTIAPATARLAIRAVDEPQGERYSGPWPRAFDLAPGTYELIAFEGDRSVVSRVEIEAGVAPPPLALRLPNTK